MMIEKEDHQAAAIKEELEFQKQLFEKGFILTMKKLLQDEGAKNEDIADFIANDKSFKYLNIPKRGYKLVMNSDASASYSIEIDGKVVYLPYENAHQSVESFRELISSTLKKQNDDSDRR